MTSLILEIAQRRCNASHTYQIIDYSNTMEILNILSFIKTDFILIGGHACAFYMPARQTKDIDLFINKKDRDSLFIELIKEGGRHIGSLSINGDSFIVNDQELDVLYCESNWDSLYYKASQRNNIKVISLEDLIIMKLKSGRLQDLADCSRMLGYASNSSLKKVEDLIKKETKDLLEDYYSLVSLGQLEVKLEKANK